MAGLASQPIYIYILSKELSISLIKDHKHKVLTSQSIKLLQNHSHMLWGYIVIDTNKILIIKYYLWLSSSDNSCIKIVKKHICSEHAY
jgi:hypothetical protein